MTIKYSKGHLIAPLFGIIRNKTFVESTKIFKGGRKTMNKKVISLVLALVMVLGTFTSVFAEPVANAPKKEAPKKEETKKEAPKDGEKVEKIVGKDNKIQYIIDKKFVEGYEDGSMGYDKNITRAEITRLLVLANGNEDLAKSLQGAMKIYTDVDTKHWANGVISVGTTRPSAANGIAMLAGYPDKSFKPERNVTYAELAKMLVVLVKKDLTADMVKNAIWATSWMLWAKELGILEDVTIANSNDFATRADAFTMVYNALYCMKYFQRTPVGETMGIISQLKNNELTLNQGDKAKTVKITNDTVFVLYNQGNTLDVNANTRKNVKTIAERTVKVSAINNPSYYYGSLVRVISNEKGEVTHILELGNPRFLAIGHNYTEKWEHHNVTDYKIDPNKRWRGVADATVETSVGRELILNDNIKGREGVAAKINYKNGSAKTISFVNGKFARIPVNETEGKDKKGGVERYQNNFVPFSDNSILNEVRLTSKTRYYVADVRRNQLTEVKDVDEAIRILGNTTSSNWFFDVYAGYDSYGNRERHETAANTYLKGYNEAKVVVFNAVQRDNNGATMLRVKNETNLKYGITFENTKGEVVDYNAETYRNYFPFNFNTKNDSAKLDVVEYSVNSAFGIEAEMMIDHSNTGRYPIVKVVDIDGRWIQVEDINGSTASLYIDTDADIFLEGQLKVGRLIQFHTLADNEKVNKVNDNNVVDIVSVMPDRYEGGLKGTLDRVVESNLWNQVAGKVLHVNDVTEYGAQYHKVIVNIDRNLYDGDAYFNRDFFRLNNTEALRLIKWLEAGNTDKYFRFKIDRKYANDLRPEIYDIEVLVKDDVTKEENWVKINTITKYDPAPKAPTVAEVKTLITTAAGKYNPDKVNNVNLAQAKLDVAEIDAAIAKLPTLEDKAIFAEDKAPYGTNLKAIKDQIKALELKNEVAPVKAEYDKLPAVADVTETKITEQNQVNELATKYNAVANAYNALSADAKAIQDGKDLKKFLNDYETAITTVDGKIETGSPVTPALVKAN